MNVVNVYCRLCAEIKSSNKQVDLRTDTEKLRQVMEQLQRINISTEFSDVNLPGTVCMECLCALDKSFQFVVRVEHAQNELTELLLKQVQNDLPSKDVHCDVDEPEHLKLEYQSDDELPLAAYKEGEILLEKYSCSEKQQIKTEYIPDEETPLIKNDHCDEEFSLPVTINNLQMKTKHIIQSSGDSKKLKTPKSIKKNDSLDRIVLSELKETWADYSWQCLYCETMFPTVDELQSHSMEAHQACNPYSCTECKFRKRRLDRFVYHVKSHRKVLKYSCYKCFMKLPSVLEVRRHTITHFRMKFSCLGCRGSFSDGAQQQLHCETYYKLHTKKIHMPELKTITDGLTCLKCSKTFTSKGSLKAHVMYMHSDQKRAFVCEACGKGCLSRSSLEQHLVSHRGERPFACHVCQQAFKTSRARADHVARHNSDKPFACPLCDSAFRVARDLRKHASVHSPALPFHCGACPRRFPRRQYLTSHARRVHRGLQPYACEECDRTFADWPNYNKHMKQRHRIDTAKKKVLRRPQAP